MTANPPALSDPTLLHGAEPIQFAEPTGGYVPGACNIGPDEIARRRRSGWIGLVAAVAVAAVAVAVGAPALARLLVVVPAFVSAIGFLQARERFCVGFAAAGVTNFETAGTIHRVTDDAARRADLRRAVGLTLRAGLIAVAVAVAFALPAI